jgi:hypothetical protein
MDNAKVAALRNLTTKLGRKPLAYEVNGLVKTRKQKKNENAYFANVMAKAAQKEAASAALKAAKKAAANEVKEKLKAEKEAQKAIRKAEKNEERAFQKALKEQEKAKAKVSKSNNVDTRRKAKVELNVQKRANVNARKTARAVAKAAKEAAKERLRVAFANAEVKARNNLTRTLGKAPQMMNIKRLAGIRTSGVNLSTNDYMRVKKYKNTLKGKSSLNKVFSENVHNLMPPHLDACAQCELEKFLARED